MFAFLAIDFETTGSLPGFPNEPWQVGAVYVSEDGAFEFSSSLNSLLYIDPQRPFNRFTPGRHAALRSELSAAPSFHGLWPQLSALLSRGPVAAHNVGTERTLLKKYAPLHSCGPWIDTLALARLAWPNAPSHALEDLIPARGLLPELQKLVPDTAPHDAFYDAVACALLLRHLLSHPAWANRSPDDLRKYSPK